MPIRSAIVIATALFSSLVLAAELESKEELACSSNAQCTVVHYGCDGFTSVNVLSQGRVTAR